MNVIHTRPKKGMVLLIVIGAIMLMSIMSVGILSRNVSNSLRAEKEIQRLQAELLAKGGFWRTYQGSGATPATFTESVGGTTYTVSYTNASGTGPLCTDQINTNVDY